MKTPELKAQELINLFIPLACGTGFEDSGYTVLYDGETRYNTAKECAIIVVNQIQDEVYNSGVEISRYNYRLDVDKELREYKYTIKL